MSPEHAIRILDDAFNSGDLGTILGFYEDAALVVPQPGVEARGPESIESLYRSMVRPGTRAKQIKTHVVEADGIALFTSRWALTIDDGPPEEFFASTVLRRQADGGWKVLIDNARGPSILGEDEGRPATTPAARPR